MSNTARDFSGSDVQDIHDVYIHIIQKKQVAGEVSLTPSAVISEWLVSFEGFSLQGYTQSGSRCRRCPVSIDLYAEEGKKEPNFFSSAQAWRPSIIESAHSSVVPPLPAAVITIGTQLGPIDHRPVLLL